MQRGAASGARMSGSDVPVDGPDCGVARSPVLRLAGGVVPLVIADRPVLFVEATQRLNALNGSAGMLVALLADGIGLAELRRELAAQCGLAPAEVDALVVEWSAQRVMAADPGPDTGLTGYLEQPSAPLLSMRAGERNIPIRFPPGSLGRELAAAYRHLEEIEGPGTIGGVCVQAMGEGPDDLVGVFDDQAGILSARHAAAPALRAAIVDLVLAQPDCVALHAACLVPAREGSPEEFGSRAILLIGAPGAGKSTLAAMVAASGGGLRLAGDDIVLFDPRRGLVMGVPLPLTIKSGSWDRLAPALPGLAALPPVLRADGQWLRYAPLPSCAAPAWRKVAAIVDLRRTDGNRLDGLPAQAMPQSPIDCLGRLLEEGFVHGGHCTPTQIRGLALMVDNAETCTLHYAEAEQALSWIEALLA
ncbi:MAG: hypothetical protein K0R64_2396 [Novosphingobium lindaniclasticum]|nr:hypothetical protein [Novosphingobium lindaniclasticum]